MSSTASVDSRDQEKLSNLTRDRGAMDWMISRLSTTEDTFSRRRVDMLLKSEAPFPSDTTKEMIDGWFRMVRLVMVEGKYSVFRMPPSGRLRPVTDVPSKRTVSKLLHPERSTAWVRDGQFRTSMVRKSTLLPR